MRGHTGTSVHLLPPPPGYWYTPFFWQVQVPYTKSQFQRFREVHEIVQIRFNSYPCAYSPAHLLSIFSDFTLFLTITLFVANCVLAKQMKREVLDDINTQSERVSKTADAQVIPVLTLVFDYLTHPPTISYG